MHQLLANKTREKVILVWSNRVINTTNSDRLPLLNIGVTFDILKISGNSPDNIDSLYISVKHIV